MNNCVSGLAVDGDEFFEYAYSGENMCVCINEEMFVFKLNWLLDIFIFILWNIYIYIIAENIT